MKKALPFLAGIFCLALLSNASAQTCTGNLLQNPGFENGLNNWEGTGGALALDAHSGQYAQQLCTLGYTVRQTVPATAGKNYTLNVFLKREGSGVPVTVMKFLSGSYQPLASATGAWTATTAWSAMLPLTATAPPGTVWVEISVTHNFGTGCVWMDDFCLTEGGTAAAKADLTFQNVNVAQAIAAGATANYTTMVKNTGTVAAANGTAVLVYLSTTPQTPVPQSAVYVAQTGSLPIAAGGQAAADGSLSIPTGTAPGNYYLIFWIDPANAIDETDKANNFSVVPVTILPLPSLPDISFLNSYFTNTAVDAGQTFPFVFGLTNSTAFDVTTSFKLSAYLSSDAFFSADDVLCSTTTIPNLKAGQYLQGLQAGATVPASTAPGTYFLILKADADGQVAELDENNNIYVIKSFDVKAAGSTNTACDKLLAYGDLLCVQPVAASPNFQVSINVAGQRIRKTIDPSGSIVSSENLGAYGPPTLVLNNGNLQKVNPDGSVVFSKPIPAGLTNIFAAAAHVDGVAELGTGYVFLFWKAKPGNPTNTLDSLIAVRTDANLSVVQRKFFTLGSGTLYDAGAGWLTTMSSNRVGFVFRIGTPGKSATLYIVDDALNIKTKKLMTQQPSLFGGGSLSTNVCRGFTTTDYYNNDCKSGGCTISETISADFVADTLRPYNSYYSSDFETGGIGTWTNLWFTETTDGGSIRASWILTGQLGSAQNDTITFKKYNAAGALVSTQKVVVADARHVVQVYELNGSIFLLKKLDNSDVTIAPLNCFVANPCSPDVTPPVLAGCPASQNLTTAGTTATATWTAPTAIDACPGTVAVTGNFAPGASFPLGTTTVVYTAKDAANNSATCSFTITVASSGGSGCTGNLLTNNAFENGQTDWETNGAVTFPAGGNAGSAKAASICGSGTRIYQTKNATAGQTYTFKVFAKNNGSPATGTLALKFMNASWTPLATEYAPVAATANWTEFTVSKLAPAGTVKVEVSILKETGAGCLLTDDACLTTGGGTPSCGISANVVAAVCNNNSTPAITTDDTWDINVLVSATVPPSPTFSVTFNGTTKNGGYGGGSFPMQGGLISGGTMQLVVKDGVDANCMATLNLTPPATCSNGDARPDIFARSCLDVGGPGTCCGKLIAGGSATFYSCSQSVIQLYQPNTSITFKDKIYLSTDDVLSANDWLLSEATITTNLPNACGQYCYYSEATYTSGNVPAGIPDGNYFLISKGDADNQIDETDETNNIWVGAIQVVGGQPPAGCAGNILTNNGFENGQTDWETSGTVTFPAGGNASSAKAASICGSGTRIYQTKNATAGQTYTFKVFAKNNGSPATGTLALKFMNASWTPLVTEYVPVAATANWTEFTVSKLAPAGTVKVEVSILKETGAGCLLADDACLTTGGGASSAITMSCPADQSFSIPTNGTGNGGNLCGDWVSLTIPTATTTCAGGGATVKFDSYSVVTTAGSVAPTVLDNTNATQCAGVVFTGFGTVSVKFKATDACGNISYCTYNATKNACTNSISFNNCPQNITVTAASGATTAVVNYAYPSITKMIDCQTTTVAGTTGPTGNISFLTGLPSGSAFPIGTTTVAMFSGSNTLTANCTFQVTVNPANTPLPDLTLANLNVTGTSVAVGAVLNFKFDLKNIGNAAASGNFTIKSYLSTDNVLSANDIQNGIVPTGNLAAGQTVSQVAGALTVPAGTVAGNYFVILKVDADGQIAESNENNNTLASATTVSVTTGGGTTGADLKVTISADKTTVPQWGNVTYTITAKNEGTAPISSAVIKVGGCAGGVFSNFDQAFKLVYAGTPAAPTAGSYNFVTQEWTISNLAAGAQGVLTIPLFATGTAEKKVVAFAKTQSPADPDSQPSANPPAGCTPIQDDEAVWTINLGQAGQAVSPLSKESPDAETADFAVFPNPTEGFCTIDLSRIFGEKVAISVSDIFGKITQFQLIDELKLPTIDLDLSRENSGVYFIKIEAGNYRPIVKRLIVNHL